MVVDGVVLAGSLQRHIIPVVVAYHDGDVVFVGLTKVRLAIVVVLVHWVVHMSTSVIYCSYAVHSTLPHLANK